MFRVSCLGVWWRHDIWISENLKFDYLKNKRSFRSKIKNIFPCFTSPLFRHTKQTSKNVSDTIFKEWWSVWEIGRFKLFLHREITTMYKFLCKRNTICVHIAYTVITVHTICEDLEIPSNHGKRYRESYMKCQTIHFISN